MASPHTHPIDDREGCLPFEPFSPKEWAVTLLLVLICFGIPIATVIHHHREMARLGDAAIREAAHE